MKPFNRFVLFSLLGLSLFAYYKYVYLDSCDHVLLYDIGQFDSRFGISEYELRAQLLEAEKKWEDFSAKELFRYAPGAEFKVNLVYSKEQENIDKGISLLGSLDKKEGLIRENEQSHNKALSAYKSAARSYENLAQAYQIQVEYWNKKGGAPEKQYEELLVQEKKLNKELARVKSLQKKVNDIAASNNKKVADYNKGISDYNSLASEGVEFDAGNASSDEINIYSYKNEAELKTLLVHEFGHVLGINHVEDENAVMYYLLNQKNLSGDLGIADKEALSSVCRIKTN